MKNKKIAGADHGDEQQAAGGQNRKPIFKQDLAECWAWLIGKLGDKGKAHPRAEHKNDLAGNIGKGECNTVDAQHLQRDELGENEAIGLQCQKCESSSYENPTAKLNQGMDRLFVPREPGSHFGKQQEADTGPADFRYQSPRHQSPDGRVEQRPNPGNGKLNELGKQLQRR
jgi:hypothetical protein